MLKACSRCGCIHSSNYVCKHNAPKIDYSKYNYKEKQLRNTDEWHKKSVEIREAANYLCEVCRDKGIYNYRELEVHHIVPLKVYPDGLLDNDNLICLCRNHHRMAERGQFDKDYLRELAKRRSCKG